MDRQYVARIIKWKDQTMVNICDVELIGKTVQGNGISMNISKEYFGGNTIDLHEALELVRGSSVANLVGDRIVQRAVRAKFASLQAVKRIGSVSFLMIFKFSRS